MKLHIFCEEFQKSKFHEFFEIFKEKKITPHEQILETLITSYQKFQIFKISVRKLMKRTAPLGAFLKFTKFLLTKNSLNSVTNMSPLGSSVPVEFSVSKMADRTHHPTKQRARLELTKHVICNGNSYRTWPSGNIKSSPRLISSNTDGGRPSTSSAYQDESKHSPTCFRVPTPQ